MKATDSKNQSTRRSERSGRSWPTHSWNILRPFWQTNLWTPHFHSTQVSATLINDLQIYSTFKTVWFKNVSLTSYFLISGWNVSMCPSCWLPARAQLHTSGQTKCTWVSYIWRWLCGKYTSHNNSQRRQYQGTEQENMIKLYTEVPLESLYPCPTIEWFWKL